MVDYFGYIRKAICVLVKLKRWVVKLHHWINCSILSAFGLFWMNCKL